MKTRTRLVVEIVALVAAAALLAVVYRLRYYGCLFDKSHGVVARQSLQDAECRQLKQAQQEVAKENLSEKIENLIAAYECGDYKSVCSQTNEAVLLMNGVDLTTDFFRGMMESHDIEFLSRKDWPLFSGEEDLDLFLRLQLDFGRFLCDSLCNKNHLNSFVGGEEIKAYRQLRSLKNRCEKDGSPKQVIVVERHLHLLSEQIDSDSGFTKRFLRHVAACAEDHVASGMVTIDRLKVQLHEIVHPLIEAGYMPKWLGEIDELVDRIEAVKCEKAGRP